MELSLRKYKIKSLFLNMLLKKGKKTNAEKIIKNIIIKIKQKTKQKPYFILKKAIEDNLSPEIKLVNIPNKKRKKRKDMYFLIFLNRDIQSKMAIKWLLLNTKLNNIPKELVDIYKKKSKILNIKKEYYKNIKKLKFNINFKKLIKKHEF